MCVPRHINNIHPYYPHVPGLEHTAIMDESLNIEGNSEQLETYLTDEYLTSSWNPLVFWQDSPRGPPDLATVAKRHLTERTRHISLCGKNTQDYQQDYLL